eukprot:1435385-Prymnesium_polylepis.1
MLPEAITALDVERVVRAASLAPHRRRENRRDVVDVGLHLHAAAGRVNVAADEVRSMWTHEAALGRVLLQIDLRCVELLV